MIAIYIQRITMKKRRLRTRKEAWKLKNVIDDKKNALGSLEERVAEIF